MEAKDWRFPMQCPTCHAVTGQPYRAHPQTAELVIELRCGTCHHEWQLSAPSPPIFFKRKRGSTDGIRDLQDLNIQPLRSRM